MLVSDGGMDWSIFDQVFLSCDLGMQKPELRFYDHILNTIDLQADQVILLDDDTDNRLAALSLGFQDVLCLKDPLSLSISGLVNFETSGSGVVYGQRKDSVDSVLANTIDPCLANNGATAIGKGIDYLQRNARNFPSYTHTGVPVKENFAQLLILEITGDRPVTSCRSQ